MTEMSSNLKKHTCPTCGGQLIVNEARRMYECPFCGVTFDYEYFREDDVLERAARAMRAGERNSAREAYEFMLAKEPSNFEALRGMILVAAGAKSTYDFARAEALKRMNTPRVDEQIEYAIEHCLPEHREYFLKMKELFDTSDTYEEGLMKNRDLHLDQKKEFSELERVSDKKNELFFEVSSWEDPEEKVHVHPKSVAYMLITAYVFYCIIVIIIFGVMRTNPYSKKSGTKETTWPTFVTNRSTTNSVNMCLTEKQLMQQYESMGMDPTEASEKAKNNVQAFFKNYTGVSVYNYYAEQKAKKAEESEAKRKQEEKAYTRKHANDGVKEVLWILIPGALITLACVYLFRRENKIKRFDGEMLAPYRERAGEITDEILKNEDSTNRLKFQLHRLYQEMKKLDPMPEKVSGPTTIKMHKPQRKRWE